jgi:hypothetical protein
MNKYVIHVSVLFFLIFSFRIPLLYNSSILSCLICVVLLLKNGNINELVKALSNKFYLFTLSCYFILISMCVFVALFSEVNDFYIIKGYVAQIVTITLSLPVVTYLFFDVRNRFAYFIRLFLLVMLTQSIIQALAFYSNDFLNIVKIFQVKEVSKLLAEGYGGIRGLALSSELTFGLSSLYALSFVYFLFYIRLTKPNLAYSGFLFLFLFIGSMFAGRTAFVGLLIGLPILVFSSGFFHGVKLAIFVFTYSFIVASLSSQFLDSLMLDRLSDYAFEIVLNYIDSGNASSASTDRLYEMLSIELSSDTFLFGDGMYLNDDGSYYMHTDSGYMRQVLYGGVVLVIVSVLLQFMFIFYPIIFNNFRDRSYIVFSVSVLFLILILHIKGEALFYIKFLQLNIFMTVYLFCKDCSAEIKERKVLIVNR